MRSFTDCYADGRLIASTGERWVDIVNPATQEHDARVRLCSRADLDVALDSARRCFAAWSATPVEDRQQALRRLAASLQERGEALVRAMAEDFGCPVWLARALHLPMALKDLEIAIEAVGQVAWQETVGNALVQRVPVGIVGAITPWNAPLHQITAKVAAALSAGCTVVLKPSEQAPRCAATFIEAAHAAQLPPGLVNLVWADAELARALVADPRVDLISFTGSTAVGKQIMAAASERVARVTLELGGKSAAVLLADADLDLALPSVVRSCMANSGQTCVSQSRLIVPRRLLADVERRLPELVQAWPLGSPLDESTRLGPVASAAQLERVQRLIAGALEAGARLVCGGPEPGRRPGFYVAATVLADVTPEMDIATQEVFGPVLSILAADDEDHAVQLANATPYGLSGAVWSRSLERAAHVARRMRTGQVVLNGAAQNLATPFGGWGQSGLGRENGRYGIEQCLEYRSLHGLAPAPAPQATSSPS